MDYRALKKMLFVVLFLFSVTSVIAQRYHMFHYNNLQGIVDSNATEIVAPLYDWDRDAAPDIIIYHPPTMSDIPVLRFDFKTGIKKYFDRLRPLQKNKVFL